MLDKTQSSHEFLMHSSVFEVGIFYIKQKHCLRFLFFLGYWQYSSLHAPKTF